MELWLVWHEKTLKWSMTVVLRLQVQIPGCAQMVYKAWREGSWWFCPRKMKREELQREAIFFLITELSLGTQPSTTWKSGKKKTNWVRSQGTGPLPPDCRLWYEARERELAQFKGSLRARHCAGHRTRLIRLILRITAVKGRYCEFQRREYSAISASNVCVSQLK